MSEGSRLFRPLAELELFLQLVAGREPNEEFLELRYRLDDGRFGHRFMPTSRVPELARRVFSLGRRTDVYVGCAPRRRREGTKDAVKHGWALWVDCDDAAAVAALETFQPAPSVLIASGTGGNRHAYWPLDGPLERPGLERANRRLAQALGADRACAEAARILRPPHSYSHKRHPPVRVEAVRLETNRRFAAEDVVGHLPDPPESSSPRSTGGLRTNWGRSALDAIVPAVYVERLLGVRVPRNRKVPCPFHEDRTPSLHVYDTPEAGWTCFSTKCLRPDGRPRGGGIYDLAPPLYGFQTRGGQFRQLRLELERLFGITRVG